MSSTSPPQSPFRLVPNIPSQDEWEQINSARISRGLEGWVPATEAIERIEESSRLHPRTLLPEAEEWSIHPDERVAIALARSAPIRLRANPARLALYFRAQKDAHEEGIAWSPLLDALDNEGVWPNESLGQKNDELSQATGKSFRVEPPHGNLSIAQQYFASAKAEDLVSLATFEGPSFRSEAASSVRDFSPFLIDSLFSSPSSWRSLARNGHLVAPSLLRWYEHIERSLESEGKEAQRLWPTVAIALQMSLSYGKALPASTQDTILGWLNKNFSSSTFAARESLPFLLSALLRGGKCPKDECRGLYQIIQKAELGSKFTALLVEKQDIPDELLEEIARDYPRSHNVRSALAKHSHALRLKEVRQVLSKSRMKAVWIGVARLSNPEEFRAAFHKAARLSPEGAVEILAKASADQRSRLRREDLLPLLKHKDADIRMAAIRALGQGIGELPADA